MTSFRLSSKINEPRASKTYPFAAMISAIESGIPCCAFEQIVPILPTNVESVL